MLDSVSMENAKAWKTVCRFQRKINMQIVLFPKFPFNLHMNLVILIAQNDRELEKIFELNHSRSYGFIIDENMRN